ncbi:MAG: hypothetical protein OHK005_13850 [Candidatus Methylacidiphilales bacterium]
MGGHPSDEITQQAKEQLAWALTISPGIKGLALVSYENGWAIPLGGLGTLPETLPHPLSIDPAKSFQTSSESLCLASAPLTFSRTSNGTYLWVLADPGWFQPDWTIPAFCAIGLWCAFTGLILNWWLLQSWSDPIPTGLRWVRRQATRRLWAGGTLLLTLAGVAALVFHQQGVRQRLFVQTVAPFEKRIMESVDRLG